MATLSKQSDGGSRFDSSPLTPHPSLNAER